MSIKTSFLLVIVIIFLSCAEKKSVHPKSENIPFSDLKTITPKGKFNIKRNVSLEKDNIDTIDIYLGDREDVTIKYLDNNNYLILDKDGYKLYKYNVNKNKLNVVNDERQGPKDLSWATDISILGDSVYISKKDFEYIVYHCSNICKHERTDNIPYQGRSISTTEKGIFLTTQQPIRDKLKKSDKMDGIIYNARSENSLFGKGYQSDAWLVRDIMNDSFLDGVNGTKVLAFKHIPYIFVYDSKEIKFKFKLDSFIKPKFIYDRKLKIISINKRKKSSQIRYIKRYGRSRYLVAVDKINIENSLDVISSKIYSLNTKSKKLKKLTKYTSDKGLNYQPILTYRNTFLYKSGRIYLINEI